ncbi:MAG TPA: hypothetical protein VJ911_06365 [Cryomorphaceae bacterium]|nr:hypothetical protein [Cryomorphaceae bacterium]
MKYIPIYLTALALCFAATSFSQYSEVILSDRTANTLSPYTVGKKTIQVQVGFRQDRSSYERSSLGNFGTSRITDSRDNDGSLKLRFGLFEKLEIIGLVGAQESGTVNDDIPKLREPTYGFGARINLYEGKDAIPAVGFEGLLSESYGFWDIDMTLALRSDFTERFAVGANASWRVDHRISFSLKPEFAIKPGIGVFAEALYRQFNNRLINNDGVYDLKELSAGLGAYFVLGENFVIDGSAGTVIESNERNYSVLPWYFDIGVSYRFDWRN